MLTAVSEPRFHASCKSDGVELTQERTVAKVTSRAGRKHHFAIGEDALQAHSSTHGRGFAIVIIGKWPRQCVEIGVTSTAPVEISKDRADKKSQIAHSWTFGGHGQFFSVGGWNSKSSCKPKQEIGDWPVLEQNDLVGVWINQEGHMLVCLNGAHVGIWHAGIPADCGLWPLVELHAKDVCVEIISLTGENLRSLASLPRCPEYGATASKATPQHQGSSSSGDDFAHEEVGDEDEVRQHAAPATMSAAKGSWRTDGTPRGDGEGGGKNRLGDWTCPSAVGSHAAPRASLVCPACGASRYREDAKFCDECGCKFSNGATSHSRSRSPRRDREVIILGHRENDTAELTCREDDWDQLRAAVAAFMESERAKIKEAVENDANAIEEACFIPEEGEIVVIDNFPEDVWAIQKTISGTFRNGESLQTLIKQLRSSEADPMNTDWLILRGAVVKTRDRRGSTRLKYYTFDHRRAWCMYRVGVPRIRMRIQLSDPVFDEFIRKADGVGRRIQDLRIR